MILYGQLLIDPNQPPVEGWLGIENGRIAEMHAGPPPAHADYGSADILITPGFYDAHLHLPQIGAIGCDSTDLFKWLQHIIYPAEIDWADPATCRADIDFILRRMLREGTLGFAGYLTTHPQSIAALAEALREVPLRAIAGQVLMDRNAPDELLNHEIAPIESDHTDIDLQQSINPRFAVACSDELLEEAASLMTDQTFIQTHLAETEKECGEVAGLFPDHENYTAIYDHFGLLTPRTLLAHCVHMDDEQWAMIADRDSIVVHCPGANTFLQSGLFDLRTARKHGVRMALGSDIAAGPDLAMPRVARAMIEVAKLRRLTIDADAHVPTPAEAWTMITRDNAEALGYERAGRIEPQATADLLLIKPDFPLDEHYIGRLIYTWHPRRIEHRIVGGKVVV